MASPPTHQRLDFIDALRGFAALWVFLYHIWNALHPWGNSQVAPVVWDSTKPWSYWVSYFIFQYGYFGVTVFFVVSGFCIHLPQARRFAATGSDGLKLKAFFQRRFWRLYPAYFAALFIASLSLGVINLMDYQSRGWPLPLPDHFYEDAFGVKEIECNAFFLLPFFDSAKGLNSVIWTLVFEVQFYLLYPLLLWIIRRIGLLPVGVILLLCEALMAPAPKTPANYLDHHPWEYLFIIKYFEWYLGVVAAELLVRRSEVLPRWGWIAMLVLAVAYSIGCVFVPVLWPYRDIAVAVATFALLLWLLPGAVTNDQPASRLLRLFVWLGLFSYSLYLLHMPLLRLINAGNTVLAEWLGHPSWERWMIFDSIPLVILASWGFYWLFERPFLKAK